MRQIRYGIFETNSSSVHTIAIPCEKFNSDVHIPDMVELTDDDYGWGFSVLEGFTDKVNYMYEVAKAYNETKREAEKRLAEPEREGDWYRRWYASLNFKYDDYVERYFEILRELGVSEIEVKHAAEYDYWGGIDHGNCWCGELDEFFDDTELMKHFLFNDKSYIVTANDNNEYYSEGIHVSQTHPYPVDTFHKGN